MSWRPGRLRNPQFGEVERWYFANGASMPFYDDYTKSAFQAAYGRAMGVMANQTRIRRRMRRSAHSARADRGVHAGDHEARAAEPRGRAPRGAVSADVSDTALNRVINFPSASWKLHVHGGPEPGQGAGIDRPADGVGVPGCETHSPGGDRAAAGEGRPAGVVHGVGSSPTWGANLKYGLTTLFERRPQRHCGRRSRSGRPEERGEQNPGGEEQHQREQEPQTATRSACDHWGGFSCS